MNKKELTMRVYTILDVKAEQWHLPFYAPTNGAAIRTLESAMKGKENDLATHPEDYSLWHVGSFDEATGDLVGTAPTQVIKCIELSMRLRLTNATKETNPHVALVEALTNTDAKEAR